jgi:hypothetical protein
MVAWLVQGYLKTKIGYFPVISIGQMEIGEPAQ